jgi:hypothetical protein
MYSYEIRYISIVIPKTLVNKGNQVVTPN